MGRIIKKYKIRPPHVSFNEDTIKNASRFLGMFECDVDDNRAHLCHIRKLKKNESIFDVEAHDAIILFLLTGVNFSNTKNITLADLVFYILENIVNVSDKFREFDGGYNVNGIFKILQDNVRQRFFDDGTGSLYEWGCSNEYWINRSLKVMNNPKVSEKFINNEGDPVMERIFRHAQNQCAYWVITGVIDMINFK